MEANKNSNDQFLATVILCGAVVFVVVGSILFFRNKQNKSTHVSTFAPPAERQLYINARESMDPSNLDDLENLKKLLMHRALTAIPHVLCFQTEGNSIERLYKRGMLTDDMHFKVKELKAYVEQEFQDVTREAEDLHEGWGGQIWPQAMQYHQMILKHNEEPVPEDYSAPTEMPIDDDKKKANNEKRKERERAKKQAAKEKESLQATETTAAAATDTPVSASVESIGESVTAPSTADVEKLKVLESERAARALLEEEDKAKKNRSSHKKSGKK